MNRVVPTSSQPVTISPVSVEGEPRLSSEAGGPGKAPAVPSALLSPRTKAAQGNGPVKRIGRPPKKGTHTTNSSLGLQGAVQQVDSEEEEVASSSKRARTDSGHGEKKGEEVAKKEKEAAENGLAARFMMFGATLNPSSGVAKEMNTVLQVTHTSFFQTGRPALTTDTNPSLPRARLRTTSPRTPPTWCPS